MSAWKRTARVLLVTAEALVLAIVLLLLMAYVGSHVREAGGAVAQQTMMVYGDSSSVFLRLGVP